MMRLTHLLVLVATAFCGWGADNEAVEAVLKASGHLANQSGYSWVSTSTSAEGTLTWRQGPTHGKTEKEGSTHVSVMLGDNIIEMALRGEKSAIKLQEQWQSAEELRDDRAWIRDRLRSYKIPARESGFLARNSVDLKPVEAKPGELSGALNGKAIHEILSRGREAIREAPGIQGRVTFRVENGQLTRYEYNLAGKMERPSDKQEVVMDRTTVVEIKDVGHTKVEVSEECLRKLQ
jgi:hypothetical protein